ncbi:hypothetical protein RKD23_003833 [Streptomyces sp. SAI-170]|uniref:hypothetical protein n=1 Tax=Streptomyces sp. SAI-170 TaxID=3377729 RepID=UPI003C7ADA1E
MKTRTSHGMAAALCAVAILAGTASQASATEAQQTDPAATPTAYANYLRHSHEEGATDALNQFQHLTRAEQNKFIDYLHDPALLKSLLDKSTEQGSGVSVYSRNSSSTTTLYNGDVTIGQERTVSGLSTRASRPLPRGNHTVKHSTYIKLFGIKIIKLNLAVNFHSNGRDITKANWADASKRNLSGGINISHGIPKKWLAEWGFCRLHPTRCYRGHNAAASVIWEGEVAYEGSVVQIDKKQYMLSNIYGRVIDYYLHNV